MKLLDSHWRGAGEHQLWWDGTDDRGGSVASGVYYLRVHAGAEIVSRKVTLAR